MSIKKKLEQIHCSSFCFLFPFYSQLLYLVPLFLCHYKEGDAEFFSSGTKAAYCVGKWCLSAFMND